MNRIGALAWTAWSVGTFAYCWHDITYWKGQFKEMRQDYKRLQHVPSATFTAKQMKAPIYQKVLADGMISGCSSGKGAPACDITLRFESGFHYQKRLGLDRTPEVEVGMPGMPPHFPAQATFWRGNLLFISYGSGYKTSIFTHQDNPYTNDNSPKDILFLVVLQLAPFLVWWSNSRFKDRARARGTT